MLVKAGGAELGSRRGPLIAGVVNATPDSFSDTGNDRSVRASIDRVERLVAEGADVIEVGGESNVSNRPAVAAAEEIDRVLPAIRAAVAAGAIVSSDTYKAPVAAAAIEAGASIVNDISGSPSAELIRICADSGAALVLVHSDVPPKTSVWDEAMYPDGVVAHVCNGLRAQAERLLAAGIDPASIVLDPGPDFAKTPAQTTELLAGLGQIRALGHPVMLAASRKDFIGAITGRRPSERLGGSLAAVATGLEAGVELIRTHDAAATRDFISVWRALHGLEAVDPGLRVDAAVRREQQAEAFATEDAPSSGA